MMVRFPIVICLLCVNLALVAQQLPPDFIDLSHQEADFPGLPVYIEEIVDATSSDGRVGIGFVTDQYRPAMITLKGGIGPALGQTLNQPTNGAYRENAVLRITGLRLNDAVFPALEMEAELAFPSTAGYEVYGPLRVTRKYQRPLFRPRHQRAVILAMEQLAAALNALRAAGEPFKTIAAANLRQSAQHYPIATADLAGLPDGVYPSYLAFRAATPEPLASLDLSYKIPYLETASATYHLAAGHLPIDDDGKGNLPWGIQQDGKAYLRIGQDYFEIKNHPAGQLTLALPANTFAGGTVSATALRTKARGIIADFVGQIGDNLRRNPNQYAKLFQIDLPTGNFIDPDKPSPTTKIAGIVVESSPLNPEAAPIALTVGDQTTLLYPGAYTEVPRDAEVCFSVADSAPQCQQLTPALGTSPTYYRVITNKKGKFRLSWMPDEKAYQLVERLEAGTIPLQSFSLR